LSREVSPRFERAKMKREKTDYPSAEEYYPKVFHCRYCGRFTHGIIGGGLPYRICNNCAVPMEYASGEHGEGYVKDPNGAVSFA